MKHYLFKLKRSTGGKTSNIILLFFILDVLWNCKWKHQVDLKIFYVITMNWYLFNVFLWVRQSISESNCSLIYFILYININCRYKLNKMFSEWKRCVREMLMILLRWLLSYRWSNNYVTLIVNNFHCLMILQAGSLKTLGGDIMQSDKLYRYIFIVLNNECSYFLKC